MRNISAGEAFAILERWTGERKIVQVLMTQAWSERATSMALVNKVLVHSEKVMVTVRDEHGAEVEVTLALGGADWASSADGSMPEQAETNASCLVTANFANGNRYVFRASTEGAR